MVWWLRVEGDCREDQRVKTIKHRVMEGYQTLGGECTIQYTDAVLQNCMYT